MFKLHSVQHRWKHLSSVDRDYAQEVNPISLAFFPPELITHIFVFVSADSILSLAQCCRKFWSCFVSAPLNFSLVWNKTSTQRNEAQTTYLCYAQHDIFELTDRQLYQWKADKVHVKLRISHFAAVLAGANRDMIFLFGGYQNGLETNRMITITLPSPTSAIVQTKIYPGDGDAEAPPPRIYSTAVPLGENLVIIFGGQCNSFSDTEVHHWYNDVHAWNIASGKWTRVETTGEAPAGRGAPTACLYKDQIIVFGGGSWEKFAINGIKGVNYFNDTFSLNTNTWEWKKLETTGDIPSNRAGHAACIVGDFMVISGGYVPEWQNFQDCYVLNLLTNHWTKGPDLPLAVGNHNMLSLQDKIILSGGVLEWAEFESNKDVFEVNIFESLKQ